MLVGLFLAAFAISALLVYLYAEWLRRNSVFEIPNARSSHSEPVPSGGGLPVMAVALGAMVLIHGIPDARFAWPMLWASVLTAMSWADDRRPLPPSLRLMMHVLAVGTCLAILPGELRVLHPSLPWLIDRLVIGLCWVWFINLYNFMDGIDGLAGSETIAVAVGVVLIAGMVGAPSELLTLATALAGAAAGFLLWNWQRARLFFGDSGSIPTGFLLGWMLIQLALLGAPVAALILPLYFVVDATVTLLKRIFRREAFWRPHREHYYQLGVRAGLSHQNVVFRVVLANLLLILCALFAQHYPLPALFIAGLAVAIVIISLWRIWAGSNSRTI